MQNDVIMAGFGGQGILLIGKMLAYAGMHEGKEVSWLPSYGPEMRGGTCNCTVVISDRPVGSPVIRSPRAVLAMNLPSLDRFETDVRPGGLLLVNSSLINRDPARSDVTVVKVPANEIANSLGNPRAANMVALGALVKVADAIPLEIVKATMARTMEESGKAKFVDLNDRALDAGFRAAS